MIINKADIIFGGPGRFASGGRGAEGGMPLLTGWAPK
jgi:hypothetical protein